MNKEQRKFKKVIKRRKIAKAHKKSYKIITNKIRKIKHENRRMRKSKTSR